MASTSNSTCASPSTSTVGGNNSCRYDVFLNHRGTDVKETFASALYDGLKAHRLEVFLDKKEMRTGQKLTCQIQGAIRAASVNIAIFSPRYCESHWCLDELLLMLESMRKSGSTILPVFLGVKPAELRCKEREKGTYAQALRLLQEKTTFGSLPPLYDDNNIGKWKEALTEVSDISGFELEKSPYNGDEGKLVAAVVERVLEIVRKTPMYVSQYPTGLNDKVEDFKKRVLWRQHESGEARVVGIVGLGGVGKTTFSKKFFNSESTKYRRSSFISDVRENASRGCLNSLQRILIKDLTQPDVQINNTNEGITLLKKYLLPSQSLIIIDDVDHSEQLDALVLPAKYVLGSNSLILVTSRDKGVLKRWGIDDLFIYELKGLDPQHSTKLFCSYAFHRPRPDAEFEQVVKEFVDACDGLPLSLKVIGALLHGEKNLDIWKAQLSKLSKILHKDIQNTLKISYDSLDELDKQIFLDTACFFIGKEKDTAIRLWDGSGWHGSLGLQNLQNKCLVEVKVEWVWDEFGYRSDAECIRMHDHVRDLGRSLAEQEPLRRIWRVAESLSDQSHVRGIKNSAERDRLVTELKLQLPNFEDSWAESIFSVELSSQLIFLRWHSCPYFSLASKISTQNLIVLDIMGDNLEILWHLETQAPLQLRELYVDSSRLRKIPESIGQLKHLEKIVLRGCFNGDDMQLETFPDKFLETLPDEFCQLQSLKHLELLSWPFLRSLPDSFGSLTSLQHFKLRSCDSLTELPVSFGNLTELQHLELHGCQELQMLPHSFGNLTKLRHINLRNCWKLQMLPYYFGNLMQLKFLDLTGCKELTISNETLGNITTLEDFSCDNVKEWPPQLSWQRSLQRLSLGVDCKELPSDMGNLSNLKILSLRSSCLEILPPSFGDLRSLEDLELESCPLKCFPDSIRMLTQLKKLRISCIKNLERLEIKECPSREVGGEIETATDSRALSKLDASEASYSNAVFPNLQHLEIIDCDRLVEVGALPTTLQTLQIDWCFELEALPGMETLVSLEELKMANCGKLKRIDGLAQLTKFKELRVTRCEQLKEVPGVRHWERYEEDAAYSAAAAAAPEEYNKTKNRTMKKMMHRTLQTTKKMMHRALQTPMKKMHSD